MSAKDLKIGETGIIKNINFENDNQHRRMMDLGFLPNQPIKCCHKVLGSTAFEVKGSKYGLRNEDAEKITLK
jgi:Fe2+ transport system protein FeoA